MALKSNNLGLTNFIKKGMTLQKFKNIIDYSAPAKILCYLKKAAIYKFVLYVA
jgi:hypothetical protein